MQMHEQAMKSNDRYHHLWKQEWRRRGRDRSYMQRIGSDEAFRRLAELELMRLMLPGTHGNFRGHFPSPVELARCRYGTTPPLTQPAPVPTVEDETSPIVGIVSPKFGRPSAVTPPQPVTIISQCRERFREIDSNLNTLMVLRMELYGHQTFLERMMAQTEESEQAEISAYVAKIRQAIGDINEAA